MTAPKPVGPESVSPQPLTPQPLTPQPLTPQPLTPQPLTDETFDSFMARLGGFERNPRLAVGVSGGADSLALALLARRWVAGRGGSLLALTVDHGLRPDSAAEAEQVGVWLASRGIPHAVLRWDGGKPTSGIQAAARDARHRLLARRCREEGILHLALAHHRDDQAETVLLRLSRGSGIDGLAGMAPVRAAGEVRVIRPLLDVPHARLVATCQAHDQAWIEDPSNHNPRFARARLRAAEEVLTAEGLDSARVSDTARRAARARAALETDVARLLSLSVDLHPEGWIRLDPRPLLTAPEEVGLRALARCLAVVGGAPYPPKAESLERLYAVLARGTTPAQTPGQTPGRTLGQTLGGCSILPRRGGLVIAREPAGAVERRPLDPGESVWWDRRFTVVLDEGSPRGATVACLGGAGWRAMRAATPDRAVPPMPEPARESLPALWDEKGLLAVPALGFVRRESTLSATVLFTPGTVLGGPAFPVVSARGGII